MIPVELRNGTKTEHAFLLLDTGTYYTVLSGRLFDTLRLKKSGVMSTVHGKTFPTAHVDIITIGDMRFSGDVGLYEGVRHKPGGNDIDGILGTDILSTGVVVIDPEKRQVILTDGAISVSRRGLLAFPLRHGKTGTYSLSALVHGEKRRFTVDTGAFGSLIDRRSVPKGSARAIPCYQMMYARGRMDVCSAVTGLQIDETQFPDLSIGVLPHPVAVDTDGTLGMDLLSQGTVILDFPNSTMYFRR